MCSRCWLSALLIGQQTAGTRHVSLAAFVAGAAVGLTAIAFGVGQTPALDVLLATAFASGASAAIARPLPTLACALLAADRGRCAGFGFAARGDIDRGRDRNAGRHRTWRQSGACNHCDRDELSYARAGVELGPPRGAHLELVDRRERHSRAGGALRAGADVLTVRSSCAEGRWCEGKSTRRRSRPPCFYSAASPLA